MTYPKLSELQTELNYAEAQLVDERRRRAMAEAELAILRSKFDRKPIIPVGDIDYGYECPNMFCNTTLNEDYAYCPGCGCEIDWRTGWIKPESVDENLAYDLAGDR